MAKVYPWKNTDMDINCPEPMYKEVWDDEKKTDAVILVETCKPHTAEHLGENLFACPFCKKNNKHANYDVNKNLVVICKTCEHCKRLYILP